MIKKEKVTKNNIVKFPQNLTVLDKEIEAIIFAAAEPLDLETIESKITKKGNVAKSLEKLQQH
jgi:segregation and condensation protein B